MYNFFLYLVFFARCQRFIDKIMKFFYGLEMNKDRLDVHYETLLRIVIERYNGLSPNSIKQYLLDEIDFKFKKDIDDEKVYLEKKTAYVFAEVTRALKTLCNKLKVKDNKSDFDPDEDESTKQQIEDYEEYPHTLVIGIPEILSNGKKGRKNSAYRLNTNIEFSIDDDYELRMATKHLYNLFSVDKEQDVNDPMVAFLTQRRSVIEDDDLLFKELKLLTDTFVQINTHEIYNPNKQYTLDFLLKLISLKADLNISIQNSKSSFKTNNVSIKKFVFDTDKFNMVCDGMSVVISDMSEIKSIESASDTMLKENIVAVGKTLENYPPFVKEYFEKHIKIITDTTDIFFQPL